MRATPSGVRCGRERNKPSSLRPGRRRPSSSRSFPSASSERFRALPQSPGRPRTAPSSPSVSVCSPSSRRSATLRPRSAGLTAWTPAPRTLSRSGSYTTVPRSRSLDNMDTHRRQGAFAPLGPRFARLTGLDAASAHARPDWLLTTMPTHTPPTCCGRRSVENDAPSNRPLRFSAAPSSNGGLTVTIRSADGVGRGVQVRIFANRWSKPISADTFASGAGARGQQRLPTSSTVPGTGLQGRGDDTLTQ